MLNPLRKCCNKRGKQFSAFLVAQKELSSARWLADRVLLALSHELKSLLMTSLMVTSASNLVKVNSCEIVSKQLLPEL